MMYEFGHSYMTIFRKQAVIYRLDNHYHEAYDLS